MTLSDISSDPSVKKWFKWYLILLIARAPKSYFWSAFLSLNPLIRKMIQKLNGEHLKNRSKKICKQNIAGISNAISCGFLYLATASNNKIPKDYFLIYLWLNYFGNLDRPSSPRILTSQRISPYLKIDSYKGSLMEKIYQKKNLIIFPLVYAQILSYYLTPTKYRLNQRYLSSSIKSKILNPIWINFTLGANERHINLTGLLKFYSIHNFAFGILIAAISFKEKFLDAFYEVKFGLKEGKTGKEVIKNYLMYVAHKSNSIVNFIYVPNLIAMFLISLTAPVFSILNNASNLRIRRTYADHIKLVFKIYIKTIGFISAFITLYVNSLDLVPNYGYENVKEEGNIRRISFLNALNLYLIRLMLLSKWRIVKENHPTFKLLNITTWYKMEALLMSLGVYKLMSLNDFIRNHAANPEDEDECNRLKNESLLKLVNRIM
ncbi:uncharacterized protein PRCAT00003653001 [Priceomyces carsonii]|uniref:uncharacterized protein n=1 Tax=Priceomyces carsonii TaxID=28549 RepID=UPI002EDB3384|nr:unnamed protein product [Priceomyces carsonii]